MTNQRAALGASGERAAARFLIDKGWSFIGSNVRIGRGEIDLLMRDQTGTIVIVEVKTRHTSQGVDPTASLSPLKVRQLYRLALLVAERYPEANVRVDAVIVLPDQAEKISHYEDILN